MWNDRVRFEKTNPKPAFGRKSEALSSKPVLVAQSNGS